MVLTVRSALLSLAVLRSGSTAIRALGIDCRAVGIPDRLPALLGLTLALAALCAGRAHAQEAISIEQPPPESVEEQRTSIGDSFREALEPARITDRLKDLLSDAPAFIRDSTLAVNLRTYYFRQDEFDDAVEEAWAVGGALRYRSGSLFERFTVGATGFTSLPLYAPPDRGGSLLLKPNQDSYSVVGELFGRLRVVDGLVATAYRHELNTPFINKNDSRMTPNTFESYDLVGTVDLADDAALKLGAAWVTRIKDRNSERFVAMSTDAGAPVTRGVAGAGAIYTSQKTSLGAFYYFSPDVLSIGYAEAKYATELAEGLGVLAAAQLTDQRSNGGDDLTGTGFAGNQVGVKLETSWSGAIGSLAYTNTTQGTDMRNPWSSYPGYTSSQVQDFDRADEQAFTVKASLNFKKLRMPGLTTYALWTHGWGVSPSVGANYDEYDLDLQWSPSFPALTGLSFRARMALVNERGGTHSTLDEYRLIVNYDFAAL